MFKPIKHYENDYLISENGEIISLVRKTLKYLKPYKTPCGYYRVELRGKPHLVHRLIAQAFIPNPDNKPFINHKDGDGLNNHISNLEWCTQSENMQHAYDTGLKTQYKGSKHYKTKLTVRDALHIKDLTILTNLPQWKIGSLYKVDQRTVSFIKLKSHKEIISYYW